MRKLVSKHEAERKKKRNQIIVGVVLVFIMVASTLGFALQGSSRNKGDADSNTVNYNGYEFVNQNGLWVIGSFVFRNTPQQVEDIGFGLRDVYSYQNLPLYIHSENEEAESEINVNLGQIAQRVQEACIKGEMCFEGLPLKTCTDNFIIIKESNNSAITQEQNCVYIEGPNEKLVGLADQFLFKILGIR